MATVDGEPWPEVREKLIRQARAMYPQSEDDADALALMAANLLHHVSERNEALALNARQAAHIARLQRKNEVCA